MCEDIQSPACNTSSIEAPRVKASDMEMARGKPGGADMPAGLKHARSKSKNATVEIGLNGGAHVVKKSSGKHEVWSGSAKAPAAPPPDKDLSFA